MHRVESAEFIGVKRHKFPDAHRRSAVHPLDAVRLPVIPISPVQLGHRHEMPRQVLRLSQPFQPPFAILRGNVRLRDLTVQRFRELPGDAVHVLRSRSSDLVYPPEMWPGIGENGSDYPSDISRRARPIVRMFPRLLIPMENRCSGAISLNTPAALHTIRLSNRWHTCGHFAHALGSRTSRQLQLHIQCHLIICCRAVIVPRVAVKQAVVCPLGCATSCSDS